MRRLAIVAVLVSLSIPLLAESIRGPVVARLRVMPAGGPVAAELTMDEIILAGIDGDTRFFDALEIEVTVPAAVTDIPGAFSLMLLTTGSITERGDIAEVNGLQIVSQPLIRPGRLALQVPLLADAETSAGAAVTVLDRVTSLEELPIAVTIRSAMKGMSPEMAASKFPVVVRPVARRIGAVAVAFVFEDNSRFQVDSYLTPEFQVEIDGEAVPIQSEYLLEPGLHRLRVVSDRYQGQILTVGVEQARTVQVDVPLVLALASVTYTAPRGSRVYVDGKALDGETGAFTATPGEHTIVVVVGDYTVSRRFSVDEGGEYNLSVTMDVTIEEAK